MNIKKVCYRIEPKPNTYERKNFPAFFRREITVIVKLGEQVVNILCDECFAEGKIGSKIVSISDVKDGSVSKEVGIAQCSHSGKYNIYLETIN